MESGRGAKRKNRIRINAEGAEAQRRGSDVGSEEPTLANQGWGTLKFVCAVAVDRMHQHGEKVG
jgi:hypothetical protein